MRPRMRDSKRSVCGVSVPTWLMEEPVKVFVKRHVRNKYDPLVDEARLPLREVILTNRKPKPKQKGDLISPSYFFANDCLKVFYLVA
ncbi:Hypothetical predicted protein [Octopus vulgaris]|uniref:Uncharacterized protein n=1 Tax=Octopus vulgaris TaxID=6645 RepID=A0AA36BLJ7_OCTVU|nr:Hypothetical predicted protein [Octopus vulgaris]